MNPFYILIPSHPKTNYYLHTSLREEEKPLTSYFYSYSYQYDWLITEENEIRRCTFNKHDALLLTNKRIYFTYNGKDHHLYLKSLTKLEFSFRRLMLPILTGGIIAPLSLIALFLQVLNLFVGFTMLLIGILLLYYGYRGTYQLVFHTPHKVSFAIFVDEPTREMAQFVSIANKMIKKRRK